MNLAPEYIKAIAPYKPGKPISELAREFGLDPASIIKLASNENPLGCSGRVREALSQAAATMLGRYPDPNGFVLKTKLAEHYDLPIDWFTLGNGSNDLLEIASLALLSNKNSAVYSEFAFTVYKLSTQARGARHIMVPARDFGHDIDAMLAAIDSDTSLVFIANPNNPTGTYVPTEKIEDFLQQVWQKHGDKVSVLIDVAYDEYLPLDKRIDAAKLVRAYSNLIITRTFSKAYGLAGLRVGYALSQKPLTDLMNRVRQPFNVNEFAQLAACVALADTDFLEQTYAMNLAGRQQLEAAFTDLGLDFVPSFTNFILLHVGDAQSINLELLRKGIIVRPVAGDGLPEHLRISIGTAAENDILIQALKEILAR